MKFIFFTLMIAGTLSANAQKTSITVQVDNLKNEKGVCRACLFNDAKSFPGEANKAISCKAANINGNKSVLRFENVPAGTYAVSVFHDENNNNELDSNFIGIPKEGYGASKNVLPKMSRPSFEDNAFTINNQPVSLNIKLRY